MFHFEALNMKQVSCLGQIGLMVGAETFTAIHTDRIDMCVKRIVLKFWSPIIMENQ